MFTVYICVYCQSAIYYISKERYLIKVNNFVVFCILKCVLHMVPISSFCLLLYFRLDASNLFCSLSSHSPGFQKFVNVLCSLNGDERKSFLQFTTGCSSLPPGGLANLHPRLTIVRKIDANDHTYPSVNTCVHYLKLPEYTSEEIMKQRLLGATREKGFHLNWSPTFKVNSLCAGCRELIYQCVLGISQKIFTVVIVSPVENVKCAL